MGGEGSRERAEGEGLGHARTGDTPEQVLQGLQSTFMSHSYTTDVQALLEKSRQPS